MRGHFYLLRLKVFKRVALTLLSVTFALLLLPVSAARNSIDPVSNAVSTLAAPNASTQVQVQVPASMKSAPFDVNRFLNVPPHFTVAVYARVSGARFLALTPDGNLLVSVPGEGRIKLIQPATTPGADPVISIFAGPGASGTGSLTLSKPHDMVFHKIGATTYLYVSETDKIRRFIYNNGDSVAHDSEVVVANLPDSSLPELRGAYGHELKNIALDASDKLYVSIGSTCNACTSDTVSDPVRGAIYQYNADGTGRRLFARGLRNAEGLAIVPGSQNDLWVVVNNRDNIACPAVNQGEGCSSVGQVSQAYVDNHPPEEFTRVRDGGNYGWPFCNPNPDTATPHVYNYDNMPFDRDQEFNATGSQLNCSTADRINKGIPAHSAPLGLTFLQDTRFPLNYRNGAVVALHGSWNRSTKTGAKVVYFPWNRSTQAPGTQQDLVSGWIDTNSQSYWGRPVDMAVDSSGDLLISDDYSGTIYRLSNPPIVVKATTDNGTQGQDTLSQALANRAFNQPVVFQLNNQQKSIAMSATLTINGNSASGPAIIDAGCSGGPEITLDGQGLANKGLVINGPAYINGLRISGFKDRSIVANAGNTQLTCVVAKR